MFDRNSEAYRQLVLDVADAVLSRLAEVAEDDPHEIGSDDAITSTSPSGLTKREGAILAHLVAGGTNRSIAARMGISPRTVEAHRAHIMKKFKVSSLAALVKAALEQTTPIVVQDGAISEPAHAAQEVEP